MPDAPQTAGSVMWPPSPTSPSPSLLRGRSPSQTRKTHAEHTQDIAFVNDLLKSSAERWEQAAPNRKPPRRHRKPKQPRRAGFHVVEGKGVVKANDEDARTCLPDAAKNCVMRLQVPNWDHATVVKQVMPRNGDDPTINDLKASQIVKNTLHFDELRRSAQCNAKGKAHRIFHLASAGSVFLVQAVIKRTDEAREHGMTINKACHCFAVTGHGPRAGTSCAIIDNRSTMPKAMLLASDLVSPEMAKSALNRFFGRANVVIQNAHVVTPAGTGNSTSAPAAKRHRHT